MTLKSTLFEKEQVKKCVIKLASQIKSRNLSKAAFMPLSIRGAVLAKRINEIFITSGQQAIEILPFELFLDKRLPKDFAGEQFSVIMIDDVLQSDYNIQFAKKVLKNLGAILEVVLAVLVSVNDCSDIDTIAAKRVNIEPIDILSVSLIEVDDKDLVEVYSL